MYPCLAFAIALAAAGCDTRTQQATLAYAAADAEEPRLRRVWADARDYASPSPDGKLITFVDWSTGDVAVHDLATGQDRRATQHGTWESNGSWAEEPLFSPDGKRIAYAYGNTKTASPFRYELRMVELGDTTQHLLLALSTEDVWVAPMDWHASAGILVEYNRADGTTDLALVSPEDGKYRVVRRFVEDEKHPHGGAVSRDGKHVVYVQGGELRLIGADGSGDRSLDVRGARLLGWSPDGGGVLFHAERDGVRGVFAVPVVDGRRVGEPVLVRDGIPALIPGGFAGGKYFYSVPVEGPRVYSAAVDFERGGLLMQPRALTTPAAGHALAPTWSPDGSSFAFVLRTPGEFAQLVVRTPDGEALREFPNANAPQLFTARWSPDGSAIYATGTGDKAPAMYRLDVQTGAFEKLFEPAGRVFRVAADSRSLLLSRPGGIFLHELASGRERRLVDVRGGGDMALSPDGSTLAYILRDSAGSRLFRMPLAGGTPRELRSMQKPTHFETAAASLNFTRDGSRLVMVIGNDDGEHQLVSVPAAGGEPTVLLDFPKRIDGPELAHVALHPDGRRILYSAGVARTELWVMEDLVSSTR